MTNTEKSYTVLITLVAVFLLMGLASYHFIVIPIADGDMVDWHYVNVTIVWIAFSILTITTAINIRRQKLVTIPTVIQCSILCLMFFTIPLAIRGGFLLRDRRRRENAVFEALSEQNEL